MFANRLDKLADVLLLVIYGGVAVFFLFRALDPRRLLARRMASVGVALLPLGWFVVACSALGLFQPHIIVRCAGVFFGLFLLTGVAKTSRKGTDE